MVLSSFPAVLHRAFVTSQGSGTGTWGRSLSEDGVFSLSARSLRSYLSNINVFQCLLCGLRSRTVCSHSRLHGQVGIFCFYILLAE